MANLCISFEQRVLDRLEALQLLRWEAGLPESERTQLVEEALNLGLDILLGEQLALTPPASHRRRKGTTVGRAGRA